MQLEGRWRMTDAKWMPGRMVQETTKTLGLKDPADSFGPGDALTYIEETKTVKDSTDQRYLKTMVAIDLALVSYRFYESVTSIVNERTPKDKLNTALDNMSAMLGILLSQTAYQDSFPSTFKIRAGLQSLVNNVEIDMAALIQVGRASNHNHSIKSVAGK